MEIEPICPFCQEPHISHYSTLREKGVHGINEASKLRNDNLKVDLGTQVHIECRKNDIQRAGTEKNVTEITKRKRRNSSEVFNFKKDCFY